MWQLSKHRAGEVRQWTTKNSFSSVICQSDQPKLWRRTWRRLAPCEKKVSEARSSVMDTAKSLSESGELVLPGGGEDDELMY